MKVGKISILYLSGILVFIIYLFSANYIFNDLIEAGQEAKLVDIELPKPTVDIRFAMDKPSQVKLKWKDALYVSGWVFRNGVKEKERDVFLVLKSPHHTLTFAIEKDTISRRDVSDFFKLDGDVNSHGFEATLVSYFLQEKSYQIGFVISDSTGMHYLNSNTMLVKEMDSWSVL